MLRLTTIFVLLITMFRSSLAFRKSWIIGRKATLHSFPLQSGRPLSFVQNHDIRWGPTAANRHESIHRHERATFPRWSLSSSRMMMMMTKRGDPPAALLDGLNPAQKEAVTQPLQSTTRVIAGPGAGKTRVLTSRVAYLLDQDPGSRILAVTFTRKAAGEMRDRLEKIVTQLEQATLSNERQQAASSDKRQQQKDTSELGIIEEYPMDRTTDRTTKSPRGLHRVTTGTFHSVCGAILRWHGQYLDSLPSVVQDMVGSANETFLNGQYTIIDSKDQTKVVGECCKEMRIDLSKDRGVSVKNILHEIARIKAEVLQGHATMETEEDKKKKGKSQTSKMAAAIYPLYRQKLLSKNMLDFDDLIYMARELLFVHPDVRETLQRRWNHVLVDEFQDTSRVQLELVKLLTSSSLLIVGDADQSIYSWRGAHVKSMSDFADEFDRVRTVYLMENYRSTSNIVKAAQKIIADSKDGALSANSKMRQDMKPMREEGPPPRVLCFSNAEKEAAFVVQEIRDLQEQKKLGSNPTLAVIYRTNVQSRALEEACVKMNLPYVIVGKATSFYQREEVKDCLCFLRWLYNGLDETAMMRAFKTPSKGLGDKAVEEFANYYKQVNSYCINTGKPKPSPFDVLISLTDFQRDPSQDLLDADAPTTAATISKRTMKNLEKFSIQMHQIRETAYSGTLEQLLSAIIYILDMRLHVQAISKNSKEEFEERWSNVQELLVATKRYSDVIPCLRPRHLTNTTDGKLDEKPAPIANFLDDVALVADLEVDDDSEGDEKRVVLNLMTIHASKGKEFDVVFIVGNEDGTFPTRQALEGNAELDEERRLCYVAVTRAKTYLYMTWREEVNVFTENGVRTTTAYRSRFLDKLVPGGARERSGQPKNGRDNPTTSNGRKRLVGTFSKSFPSNNPRYASTTRETRPVSSAYDTTNVYTTKSNPLFDKAPKPGGLARSDEPARRQPLMPRSPLKPVQPKPFASPIQSTFLSRQPEETRHKSTTGKQQQQLVSKSTKSAAVVPTKQKTPSERHQVQIVDNSIKPDSTWFYPVGSSVLHKNHGEGVVLPPPTSPIHDNDRLLVRVKFGNGEVLEFDAVGVDLLPN